MAVASVAQTGRDRAWRATDGWYTEAAPLPLSSAPPFSAQVRYDYSSFLQDFLDLNRIINSWC